MSFFRSGTKDAIAGDPGVVSSGKPAIATRRHSKFFFDHALVVIQIEDLLFGVHKYQLLKSETFSDMFKIAGESNPDNREGSSPENPIIMSGVKASDFEALLTVLYATQYEPDIDTSLIIPAYRLANMWDFKELCTYLVVLAEKVLSDVDKIVFARESDVKDWIVPAHVRLCQRNKTLTSEEASKLGPDSLLLMYRIKEDKLNAVISATKCPNHLTTAQYLYCSTCQGNFHFRAGITTDDAVEQSVKTWFENGCLFAD
ncbi:hypothetical protein BDV93DRAFT_608998 [Ceratobasidium sp. AG-I]|nr:hypothetical protein BDV93DRAFT_608998 [Ceratobasidium sp. AG-I]